MADEPQRTHRRPRGLIGKTIEIISRIVGVLIFSALLSILIEWIGMRFWLDEPDFQHARTMLLTEIAYLNAAIPMHGLSLARYIDAGGLVERAVHWMFLDSGFTERLERARAPTPNDFIAIAHLKAGIVRVQDYLIAAGYILAVFLVRLIMLVLSLPVFVMSAIVGLIDGLVQRDLRKWGAGIESSFVYHIAKNLTFPILSLAWVLYLALPTSVHPTLIIVPFALAFGLSVTVTASKFKKWL